MNNVPNSHIIYRYIISYIDIDGQNHIVPCMKCYINDLYKYYTVFIAKCMQGQMGNLHWAHRIM